MTLLLRADMMWKVARLRRQLRLAGDTREMWIPKEPGPDPEHPFELHASDPLGTDVPVGRDAWPGLETGPQDVHGGDEAA